MLSLRKSTATKNRWYLSTSERPLRKHVAIKWMPKLQLFDVAITPTSGYNRAYKHSDTPSEDVVKKQIYDAVMNEICEWFVFDEVKD